MCRLPRHCSFWMPSSSCLMIKFCIFSLICLCLVCADFLFSSQISLISQRPYKNKIMEISLVGSLVDDIGDGIRPYITLSTIFESMKRANANSCDAPEKFPTIYIYVNFAVYEAFVFIWFKRRPILLIGNAIHVYVVQWISAIVVYHSLNEISVKCIPPNSSYHWR